MAALGTILGLVGTATTVLGNKQAGAAAQANAEAEAAQLNRNAAASRAMGQREAINQDRQTKFLMSRAQALAAASGGSATDPTVVKLIGDIAGEGEYRRLNALYNGENQATTQEYEAQVDKATGIAKNDAYSSKSVSTVLDQGSSYFQKYGAPFKRTTQNVSDPGYANMVGEVASGAVY